MARKNEVKVRIRHYDWDGSLIGEPLSFIFYSFAEACDELRVFGFERVEHGTDSRTPEFRKALFENGHVIGISIAQVIY